jgi:hypothetical protein
MSHRPPSETIPEATIREALQAGRSASELASSLNCIELKVHRDAARYGLLFGKVRLKSLKGYGNLPAFQTITDREIAYILGFLWADGYVGRYGVRIALAEEDGKHLSAVLSKHCFIKTITTNRQTPDAKRKPQLTMFINDASLARYLMTLDYGEKSYVAPTKVLATIPTQYHSAFWLGYHDGDGFYDPKRHRCGYGSSYHQDWSEMVLLCQRLGVKWSIRHYKHPTKPHSFSQFNMETKANVSRFVGYLYWTNLGMGLPRKAQKFSQMVTAPWRPPVTPSMDPIDIEKRARRNEQRRRLYKKQVALSTKTES